jgi:hypothetical protein
MTDYEEAVVLEGTAWITDVDVAAVKQSPPPRRPVTVDTGTDTDNDYLLGAFSTTRSLNTLFPESYWDEKEYYFSPHVRDPPHTHFTDWTPSNSLETIRAWATTHRNAMKPLRV